MAATPLRRRDPASAKGQLRFDADALACRPGESLVSTLWAAGVFTTSRSAKYRRPRGAFCLRGDCGTCLVRADGQPSRRACMEISAVGRSFASQNKMRPDSLDPTRLVDHAFRKGMDHHHLMVRPRVVNQVMQTIARDLTGFGHLPDASTSAAALASGMHLDREHHTQAVDVLVVGAGPAGQGLATELRSKGVSVELVDRRPPNALQANPLWLSPRAQPTDIQRVGIFAAYPGEQLIAGNVEAQPHAAPERVTAPHPTPGLRTYRARHIVVATGARDTMIPFANNDRPGVVAARGLAEMLARDELECTANSIVVVGDDAYAHTLAEHLHARRVNVADVREVLGSQRVRGLRTRDRKITCELVALAATPAPAHELAVMAGARTEFNGDGFAVQRDADGVCAQMGDTTVWAVGDVCGYMGPDQAYEDGRRVASNLLARLEGQAKGDHDPA